MTNVACFGLYRVNWTRLSLNHRVREARDSVMTKYIFDIEMNENNTAFQQYPKCNNLNLRKTKHHIETLFS